MFRRIQFMPLVIGITIGVIALIYVKPEKNVIYKYPNPESSEKIIYKDKNGICYGYSPKKVDCDKNEDKLKNFPLNK
jgi:hypothetical protein